MRLISRKSLVATGLFFLLALSLQSPAQAQTAPTMVQRETYSIAFDFEKKADRKQVPFELIQAKPPPDTGKWVSPFGGDAVGPLPRAAFTLIFWSAR